MSVITSGLHSGDLPPSKSFVEVLTPNVELAAMKKTEDDDNIILRLYETEGRDTEARVRITDIVKPDAAAWETDLLERKLPHSTALMKGGVLSVSIPAHGIVTVTIEQ
jgi:alpha-mannosidase